MKDTRERETPHWSADFVEHIRTVHFALLALCLALIGVVQFKKPLDVTAAQSQLQEIKSAVDGWEGQDIFAKVECPIFCADG